MRHHYTALEELDETLETEEDTGEVDEGSEDGEATGEGETEGEGKSTADDSFKGTVERIFFDYHNSLLLKSTDPAKQAQQTETLLNNINLEIETRLGAKFKDITANSDFCYYLSYPANGLLRCAIPFEASSVSKYLQNLALLTEGNVGEDGKLTGSYKANFSQFAAHVDLVSLAKTRHLTRTEALAVLLMYAGEASEYISYRLEVAELIKIYASILLKLATGKEDVSKEAGLLASRDPMAQRISGAESLLEMAVKLITSESLQRGYSSQKSERHRSALIAEMGLEQDLARAVGKMSDTWIDLGSRVEHKYLVDTCSDLIVLRWLAASFKVPGVFEDCLDKVVRREHKDMLDKIDPAKVETADGLYSTALLKVLAKDADSRLQKNANLSSSLRETERAELIKALSMVKTLKVDQELQNSIQTDAVDTNTAELRDKHVKPATEMIYAQSPNDPGIKAIENILGQCLEEINNKKIDDLLAKIPDLVYKRFGLKISEVRQYSERFNHVASCPLLSEGTQLLTGLYEVGSFELLNELGAENVSSDILTRQLAKAKQNKVHLNLKTAKWTGLETIAAQQAYIALNIKDARESGLTARELAAAFFHELGHIFTYYEYAYTANRTNILLLEVLENASREKPDVDYIFHAVQDLGVEGYDRRTIQQSLEDPNKKVIFLSSLTYVSYSAFTQDIRRNLITASNSEQMADSFSIRLGYGSDNLTGLDKFMGAMASELNISKAKLYSIYHQEKGVDVVVKATYAGFKFMFAYVAYTIILAFLLPVGPLAYFLRTYFLIRHLVVNMDDFGMWGSDKKALNEDLDYGQFKRITRAVREVIKQLKVNTLGADEKKSLLKAHDDLERLLREVEGHIGKSEDSLVRNLHSSVLNVLFTKGISRADSDLYYLQLELEKILDNQLYLSAARLSTYEKS